MMVYMDKEDQFTSLGKYAIIGEQRPIYCTSLGKALILNMDDEEIHNLLPGNVLQKYGPSTHIDVESLIKDIHICKVRGWTHDNEEAEPGVNCVLLPIRDYRGQIIASISTSWLLEIRPELEAEKTSFVVKTTNGISKAMGFAERP